MHFGVTTAPGPPSSLGAGLAQNSSLSKDGPISTSLYLPAAPTHTHRYVSLLVFFSDWLVSFNIRRRGGRPVTVTARVQTGLADPWKGCSRSRPSSSVARRGRCPLAFRSSPAPATGKACRVPNAHRSALGGLSRAHCLYIEEVWAGPAVAVAGGVASQAPGARRGLQEPRFEQQMRPRDGWGQRRGPAPHPFRSAPRLSALLLPAAPWGGFQP